MNKLILLLALPTILLAGCQSNPSTETSSENLTVGLAQKHIKIGMDQASVLSVFGSPNMVSTDKDRNEIWVYDKVSTNAFSKTSDGFVFSFIAGASNTSSSMTKTQQTLTIVIKYDSNGTVKDFSYHSSKF